MTYYTVMTSPVGQILLLGERTADERFALSGVYLHEQRYEPAVDPQWIADAVPFTQVREQLTAYFGGEITTFDVVLAPRGSQFQQSVWSALAAISFGATQTYGEVAERVADRSKTRAVAAAIGRNPISIVVPCHRVIGADGSLTGYAGGLDRKRWLLDHEAAASGAVLAL